MLADSEFELVTAFEVFEHFLQPDESFDELFKFNPRMVLFSTELYEDQDESWPYLAPESGQHIFFYSPAAISLIAKHRGYAVTRVCDLLLFYKPDIPKVHELIISARTAMNGWIFQAIKSYCLSMSANGFADDSVFLQRITDASFLDMQ